MYVLSEINHHLVMNVKFRYIDVTYLYTYNVITKW